MINHPNVVESMAYKMPTYRLGDGWVALANQKQYVSLYTCRAQHLVDFKLANPSIKTGKGCINFKDSDELPEESVAGVIQLALNAAKP